MGISQKNGGIDNVTNKLPNENGGEIIEKKDWKYFWNRVLSDFTNRDLMPVKVLFFFKYSTLFVLYPFLSLHMQELGLNEFEIGINQATSPVVAILGPPFVGIVADKIGNFKVLLSVITLVNAGMALLLLLVPTARETVTLPNFMTYELSCNNFQSNHFILQSIDDSICTLVNNENGTKSWENLSSSNLRCGVVCPANAEPNLTLIPYSKFVDMDFSKPKLSMTLPDKQHFIRFFENKQPDLVCTQQSNSTNQTNELCSLNLRVNNDSSDFNPLALEISKVKLLNRGSEINVTNPVFEIVDRFFLNGKNHQQPTCKEYNIETNENESGCSTKCFVQFDRDLFCSNKQELKVYSVGLTFGIYTLIRLLLGFASATTFIMFEGAVLAIMKQYGGDYGLQRVFATLAAIFVAPASGSILKAFGFRPVIILYAVLKAISAFVTLGIDLEFKKPAEKVMKNLKQVLSKIEILVFFAAMLWSGTVWGYLETFLFLYLERIGGSRLLMGLTLSVGGLFGLPLLIFSRPIIKRIGHVNCLCLGLLFYCFRYFGYSIMTNPWQCLIFEALEAVTVSLAITAASTYAVALSTLSTIASIQGLFGCLYFGIGRGAGSLIGGALIKNFGHVQTFRIFGVGSFIGAVLYFLVNLLYLRKHSSVHLGPDINNLHLEDTKNKDNKLEGKNETTLGANNGYIGPLATNKFTDVPLDEY